MYQLATDLPIRQSATVSTGRRYFLTHADVANRVLPDRLLGILARTQRPILPKGEAEWFWRVRPGVRRAGLPRQSPALTPGQRCRRRLDRNTAQLGNAELASWRK